MDWLALPAFFIGVALSAFITWDLKDVLKTFMSNRLAIAEHRASVARYNAAAEASRLERAQLEEARLTRGQNS